MAIRTYHDPLHLGIHLDSNDPCENIVIRLIDSTPFQRLRRIRQLGPASLTFHGAESSRFTHSLGVFHLARRAFQKVSKIDKNLSQYRALVFAAALLHDLGHGPLSHTGEEMFGIKHEKWSSLLINNHPEIKEPLDQLSKGTSEAVANLIANNRGPHKVAKALISSQLDCDRLDYLMRDSYSTGTNYGQLDLERILSALTISPDGELAIHPKGLMAVEHYLVVRNLMYRSVYNHRMNEICSWLLEQAINVARSLGEKKIWTDIYMKKWLWSPEKIDIETFLANDDIRTTYHLINWKDNAPEPLAEICRRYINRDLLKAVNIVNNTNEYQLEALSIARQLAQKANFNPDIYCGLRQKKIHGYEPYKGGLRLWDGENLEALENASPLINQLIHPEGSSWLIHPKEIHEDLKKRLQSLTNKN